jgi:hypothetical protein
MNPHPQALLDHPPPSTLLKPLPREFFDFRSDSASSSAEPSPVATGKDQTIFSQMTKRHQRMD